MITASICIDYYFPLILLVLDDFEDAPNYYKRLKIEIKIKDLLNDEFEPSKNSIVQCSSYQLTNFRPELLNLKFHKNYSSSLAPPYTEM